LIKIYFQFVLDRFSFNKLNSNNIDEKVNNGNIGEKYFININS